MKDPLVALLPEAITLWEGTDPDLARVARAHPPAARPLPQTPPFEALATSIIHQQVSMAAGRTIQARVTTAAGGALTPEGVLAAGPDALRAAGLSGRKVQYVLDLAERARTGALDLARLARESDEEVVATLTAVKGIGVWTAKMFLLFHLDRPDVVAHEDGGLQIAASRLYGVPRDQAAKEIKRRGPAWSPYASVAALVLWNWKDTVPEARA